MDNTFIFHFNSAETRANFINDVVGLIVYNDNQKDEGDRSNYEESVRCSGAVVNTDHSYSMDAECAQLTLDEALRFFDARHRNRLILK